jgi:hypothetical protein
LIACVKNIPNDKLKDFMIDKNIKMIIIDGELMPWSAIGSKLIDEEFMAVDAGLKSEITYMKKYNMIYENELKIQRKSIDLLKKELLKLSKKLKFKS